MTKKSTEKRRGKVTIDKMHFGELMRSWCLGGVHVMLQTSHRGSMVPKYPHWLPFAHLPDSDAPVPPSGGHQLPVRTYPT